jgi:hypothetical protein
VSGLTVQLQLRALIWASESSKVPGACLTNVLINNHIVLPGLFQVICPCATSDLNWGD